MAFADWLRSAGLTAKPYPQDRWLDLYAGRRSQELLAEIKGRTSEPGIDADIAYGQLLRRMPDHDSPEMFSHRWSRAAKIDTCRQSDPPPSSRAARDRGLRG